MRGFISSAGGHKPANKAKSMMMAQIRNGGVQQESAAQKQKKMIEAKINDLMNKVLLGSKNLSDVAKKSIQKNIQATEKKKAMMEAQSVVIKSKSFSNGGKIDGSGKIYNKAGQVVGTVDPATGKIKNKMGFDVGKYKDDMFCNAKISNMIEKNNPKQKGSGPMNIWSTHDSNGGGTGWW